MLVIEHNSSHRYTYIIGHYSPSGRITALLLTPRIIDSFLRNFFMADLFSLRVFIKKSAKRKLPKKYFHILILMPNLGYEHGLYI